MTLTQKDFVNFAEIKVVEHGQVHDHTKDGWRVLGVVASTSADIAYYVQIDGQGVSHHMEAPMVVSKPLFVLGLARDKVMDTLRERVKELEASLKDTEGRETQFRTAATCLSDEVESWRARCNESYEELKLRGASNRKLEEGLAELEAKFLRLTNYVGKEAVEKALEEG